MQVKNVMKIQTAALRWLFFLIVGLGVIDAGPWVCSADGQALHDAAGRFLRVGVHVSEMGQMDPHFAAGSQDRMLADMVFNGLLRYAPGRAPVIEPDLAEAIPDFEMIGGKQVWTVKLRHGVMFHAGPDTPAYELTAADVVYSLQKSANRAFCAYAGEYEGMTFESVDPYTLNIIPDRPLSAILFFSKLTDYAGGFIVSKRAIVAMGYERFKNHPVGTGPFRFTRYNPGQELVLTAHEAYFRGRPQLAGVKIHFVPDIDARSSALKQGDLDVIMGSGEKGWAETMAAESGLVVDTHGVGEVATIFFNTALKPLDDIRVRRALALSLNRQAFLETASKAFVGSVYSPVPDSFLPGGIAGAMAAHLGLMCAQDLGQARQLLAQAGYPNGFTLDVVTSEKRLYRTYYEEMCRQLAQIGVDCHVTVVSHSQMHRQIRREPKAIVIYVAWRPNADAYLSRFFHSDAIIVSGRSPDTNFSHYDKIDRLIEGARLAVDPNAQISLWQQAQIRILHDVAAYPIMYTKQCYARRNDVDYGHPLINTMALYPQFTENTRLPPTP
jgi:peptide/nickel transport system substrate-binding protein